MKLSTLTRAVAAAALIATTAGTAWSQTTLLFNSFLPQQHPVNTRVLKPWADDVAAATQGPCNTYLVNQKNFPTIESQETN